MAPGTLTFGRDGWLEPSTSPLVVRIPTARTTTLLETAPLATVWHWTAGNYRDRGHEDAVALARSIAERPAPGEAAASWNILLDKDGTVVQSAPLTVGTWHVGKPGTVRGRTTLNVNRVTVGIELENAGRLQEHDGRVYAWPYSGPDGKPSPKYELDRARAVKHGDALFDAFTPAQEASAELLVRALVARFGWPREAFAYGHVHFDHPRKEDPGPVWLEVVLPRILDRVLGPGAASAP